MSLLSSLLLLLLLPSSLLLLLLLIIIIIIITINIRTLVVGTNCVVTSCDNITKFLKSEFNVLGNFYVDRLE